MLDAIVIGAGPSGISAALSLAGWMPHIAHHPCDFKMKEVNGSLSVRLEEYIHSRRIPLGMGTAPGVVPNTTVIDQYAVPGLANGLQGVSHFPSALLFDTLHLPDPAKHTGKPKCLELKHETDAGLDFLVRMTPPPMHPPTYPLLRYTNRMRKHHVPLFLCCSFSHSHMYFMQVLDPQPFGGSWHQMHEATRTLSPGRWLEFPNYGLAQYLHKLKQAERVGEGSRVQTRPLGTRTNDVTARQERGTVARYYDDAATNYFKLGKHKVNDTVASAHFEHAPTRNNQSDGRQTAAAGIGKNNTTDADGSWVVTVAGSAPGTEPLRAKNLVIAVGTAGHPYKLGVPGEELPQVSHKCAKAAGESGANRVLVVGAGLSASDCIVHHLQRGRHVVHVFRGVAATSSVVVIGRSRTIFPEYHALAREMLRSGDVDPVADPGAGAKTVQLMGGLYTGFGRTVLHSIDADGTCILETTKDRPSARMQEFLKRQAISKDEIQKLLNAEDDDPAVGEAEEENEENEEGVEENHAVNEENNAVDLRKLNGERRKILTNQTVVVDTVAILIGAQPDFSFLSAETKAAMVAAGPPERSINGVNAKHKVYFDVDHWTNKIKLPALPHAYATGPLRGDNIFRFAAHDGYAIGGSIRDEIKTEGAAGATQQRRRSPNHREHDIKEF
jgi:hypothetical protein